MQGVQGGTAVLTRPGAGRPTWSDLPTWGEHRGAARRVKHDAFLEAAGRIVATEGRDCLTMERLAEAVGCAIGTVYIYFPSKDALLEQVDLRALEVLPASLDEQIDAQGHPGTDPENACLARLLHIARTLACPTSEHLDGVRALRRVLADPASLHALLGQVSAVIDIATGAITRAQECGALEAGDAGLRARVLVATAATAPVLGASNEHESDGEPLTPPSGTALARALLLSWGARRRTLLGAEKLISESEPDDDGEGGSDGLRD